MRSRLLRVHGVCSMNGAESVRVGDQDELPSLTHNASADSVITMYVGPGLCRAGPIHIVRAVSRGANEAQRFKMVLCGFRLSSLRKALRERHLQFAGILR